MSKEYNPDDVILTVDVAIQVDDEYILLIERAKEPFMDKLVLPGGHVDVTDVSLPLAAEREIKEELGLDIPRDEMELLIILDGINRDPRKGRRVSVVYTLCISMNLAKFAMANSDAKAFHIKRLDELTEDQVGFDHWLAIDKLRKSIINNH